MPLVFVKRDGCPVEHRKALDKAASMYRKYGELYGLGGETSIYVEFTDAKDHRADVETEKGHYGRFVASHGALSLSGSLDMLEADVAHETTHIALYPYTSAAWQMATSKGRELLELREETVTVRIEHLICRLTKNASPRKPYSPDYEPVD